MLLVFTQSQVISLNGYLTLKQQELSILMTGTFYQLVQEIWSKTCLSPQKSLSSNGLLWFEVRLEEFQYPWLYSCTIIRGWGCFLYSQVSNDSVHQLQKQRIQLARGIYNDSDVYFLDDLFSAVDAHTAAILFYECVVAALAHKIVILVTH